MEPQHKHNSSTPIYLGCFIFVLFFSRLFLLFVATHYIVFECVCHYWWWAGRRSLPRGQGLHCEDLSEVRMNQAPLDCTPKCRSQQHADQVVAALTSGSEGQLRAFLTSHCHNAATLRDALGRTALHLAASLGKKALLEWLLEIKSADLMLKDKESGWTALHRSAFYGQIHCLISLVKVCVDGVPSKFKLLPRRNSPIKAFSTVK